MSCEGSQGKRTRSANYTQDEKSLLLTLIQNYKNIIENKKTDQGTNKDKEKAWIEIANKLNARFPNKVLRTVESLHKFYVNIKKKIRKDVAEDRMNRFATGGCPSVAGSSTDTTSELAMSIMIEKTIFGLHNPFDCDSFIISDPIDNVVVTEDDHMKSRSQEKEPERNIIRGIAVQSNDNILENIRDNDNTSSNEIDVQVGNWSGSEAAANLKIPVSSKLLQYTTRKKARLAATPSSSIRSKMSEKYCHLVDTKLEICNLQQQSLQLEIEMKKIQMRHAKEEFQTQMRHAEEGVPVEKKVIGNSS